VSDERWNELEKAWFNLGVSFLKRVKLQRCLQPRDTPIFLNIHQDLNKAWLLVERAATSVHLDDYISW